jgi:hypothetical protein
VSEPWSAPAPSAETSTAQGKIVQATLSSKPIGIDTYMDIGGLRTDSATLMIDEPAGGGVRTAPTVVGTPTQVERPGPARVVPPAPGEDTAMDVNDGDLTPVVATHDARKPLRSAHALPRELAPTEGVGTDINLPSPRLPTTARTFAMRFSVLSQIDGLLYKCQGRGARIERDVLSPCKSSAVCEVSGCAGWQSTASFCGLYFCGFEHMPAVVATVASHRGYGVFVVPVVPEVGPALGVLRTTKAPDGSKRGVRRRYGWYQYLLSHSRMVFDLPHDAFTTLEGEPLRHPFGVQAILAQFGTNGRFKAKPRVERSFRLHCIPALDSDGPKLGVRPSLLHMVSPLAEDTIPTKDDDIVAPSPDLDTGGERIPTPLVSRWAPVLEVLRGLAADFPCQQVAALALSVATTGLNTFKGMLSKAVVHDEPAVRDDVAEMAKRTTLMKEVDLDTPRISGPTPSCPFTKARVCPISTRKKDTYDPFSKRLRLISDFSRRRKGDDGGSVNDLCWSPRLLSYHASPDHLRDTLAWLFLCFGPGIVAWTADIPSCFRLNHLCAVLLSLFVYKVVTVAFGVEWFVDLATPFGWSPAEWGWQCMLALIMWAFRKKGLGDMVSYVDNFFLPDAPQRPAS